MQINWFPGHMTKALREIQAELSRVDSVVYILDSRAPSSSLNPELDMLLSNKPTLIVLNKSDLVGPASLQKWKAYFLEKGFACIYMNSLSPKNTKYLIDELKNINSGKISYYKQKGANIKLRVMVVGIPNSGKSTLINNLSGQKKVKKADKPGTTRGQQVINIDRNIDIIDSPGVLYPNLKDKDAAIKLAIIGSIKDEVVNQIELSKEILKLLLINYPIRLSSRYKIEIEDKTVDELFMDISKARGNILKGGEIDADRTAKMIVSDFRKANFGLICLDDIKLGLSENE